ncbi:MAG: hypothetical protein KDB21_11600 [Acidimicrobiales bacterium]|nr:hypothetical protein [Acidimicrobiales bacterium]
MPVRQAIDEADAVFVGRVLSVDRRDDNAAVTFAVERLVKGSGGDRTVLLASYPDDECGGGRYVTGTYTETSTVVFVHRRSAEYWAPDICGSLYDPELVPTIFGGPPPATGQGPGRFVIAGEFEWGRLVVLDDDVRPLAYGREPGATHAISTCPDRRSVIEAVDTDGVIAIAWRDIVSLEITAEFVLDDATHISRLVCLGTPDDGAVFTTAQQRQLRFVRTAGVSLFETPSSDPSFAVDLATRRVYLATDGISAVDLADAAVSRVVETEGSTTSRVALDPDGRLLGVWRNGTTDGPPTAVYDTTTGAVATSTDADPGIRWVAQIPLVAEDALSWELELRRSHGELVWNEPSRLMVRDALSGELLRAVENPFRGVFTPVGPVELSPAALDPARNAPPVALPLPGDELPTRAGRDRPLFAIAMAVLAVAIVLAVGGALLARRILR